jgi:acetolactate synthase-1/2/3 large subunit
MMVKLSDYLMQFIADHGVKHVFMVPGGGAMHLNDSLGRCRDLQYVCNLHEQACSIAAEAYAKTTGNMGVTMVTCGPGGTNAVTGVAGAWLDSTPCLFLSGQVKRADLKRQTGVRQMGVQEIGIVDIVSSITKYAVTITDPATVRYHMEKAWQLATTGRPGPVWIDVPLDVQAATIDPEQLPGFTSAPSVDAAQQTALEADVARVIDALNSAERPVLLAGNGIRLSRAQVEFEQLIECLGIPVLATWLALDLLPEEHKLFMGRPGGMAARGPNFALQNSDCMLSLGARLDLVVTAYAPERFARGARRIMVDIDPAELAKNQKFIDVPVCADAGAFMREFLRQSVRLKPIDRTAWLDRCRQWKEKYPIVLPEHRNSRDFVSVYALAEAMGQALEPGELIVSGSSGTGIEIFLHAYKVGIGQRILHCTALGAMGFGLPMSLGAAVASGKRVICVDGDGGFQFNIQELETIHRLNLPIKFFVLNNGGFASIRLSQNNYFPGNMVAADATSQLTLPDVRKVAAAYGLATARIASPADLDAQIRTVLAMPGPVVCEVMVIPDEVRQPRVASAVRADGSMVSKPLEDLWPFLDRDEFRANMIIEPLPE